MNYEFETVAKALRAIFFRQDLQDFTGLFVFYFHNFPDETYEE
jgi:hypothetical protein